jgi:hypothetical protein
MALVLLHWHNLHDDRHLTAPQLRISAEPTIGPDPWAGTFPTTSAGKTPHPPNPSAAA